jgi:hypothetical protein
MGNSKYIGRVGALSVALGIGAAAVATPWVASAKPDGTGPCSSACAVGSEGQGGTSSGDKPNRPSTVTGAQGGYVIRPARVPDTTVRFAGPADSGLLELSGAIEGSIYGHIHDRETGQFTGRLTGVESPNPDGSPCTGQCNIG